MLRRITGCPGIMPLAFLRWAACASEPAVLMQMLSTSTTMSATPQGHATKRKRRPAKSKAATPQSTFTQLAAEAASRNVAMGNPSGWIDDTQPETDALEAHRKSPEYRELHRPGLTNAAMGLYGGEPGFEKTHRVWVDPDNSHLKYMYNSSPLAKNIRYSRYGYYKREMHLLDIDKLVRHARMLPSAPRLLTDFLVQKVPLADRECAALMRHARQTLQKLSDWQRKDHFPKVVEMFERMLTTNIPPVEVGVETHAEAIRCCAIAQMWEEGWMQYRQRAMDLEGRYLDKSNHANSLVASTAASFVLNSRFFDAVIELCVACGRVQEGEDTFGLFLERGIRPPVGMLNNMMLLSALAIENGIRSAAEDTTSDEVWGLYEFFDVARNTASIRARMHCCAMAERPEAVLEALRLADQQSILADEMCYCWVLYALRHVADMGDFVLDTLGQIRQRGLCVDYRIVTYALMYCAHQGEGDAAMVVYQQCVLAADMSVSPEMLLLLLQSFRRCPQPTTDMLLCAQDCWQRFHRVGSAVDMRQESLEEMFALCGRLGAAATAFSLVKEVATKGDAVTCRMLNNMLRANAVAASPNGSASLADEVVELFVLLQVEPNIDTAESLMDCHGVHGSTARVQAFTNNLIQRIQAQDDAVPSESSSVPRRQRGHQQTRIDGVEVKGEALVGEDAEMPPWDTAPHRLRILSTPLHLDVEEIALKKYGQTLPIKNKEDDASTVLGRVQPFGNWAGMVDV